MFSLNVVVGFFFVQSRNYMGLGKLFADTAERRDDVMLNM